jgi:hypothetical protein
VAIDLEAEIEVLGDVADELKEYEVEVPDVEPGTPPGMMMTQFC